MKDDLHKCNTHKSTKCQKGTERSIQIPTKKAKVVTSLVCYE